MILDDRSSGSKEAGCPCSRVCSAHNTAHHETRRPRAYLVACLDDWQDDERLLVERRTALLATEPGQRELTSKSSCEFDYRDKIPTKSSVH
jgi:hypothetical protein